MEERAKVVTLSAVALCALVLVVGAVVLSEPIAERWYLHQLQRGDPRAKAAAAKELGAMGSVRAIPALLEAAAENLAGPEITVGDLDGDGFADVWVATRQGFALPDGAMWLSSASGPGGDFALAALVEILARRKRRALNALCRGLRDAQPQVRAVAGVVLGRAGFESAAAAAGELRRAIESETVPWARSVLQGALQKVAPKGSEARAGEEVDVRRTGVDLLWKRSWLRSPEGDLRFTPRPDPSLSPPRSRAPTRPDRTVVPRRFR